MPLFKKRKDEVLIPPVQSSFPSSDSQTSWRSNTSTYNNDGGAQDQYRGGSYSSRDDESGYAPSARSGYGNAPAPDDGGRGYGADRGYSHGNTARNPFARGGQRNLDAERAELFAGAGSGGGSNRFADGPGAGGRGGTPPPTGNEEDDVEAIKQQTRFLKQDTVQSSRNALRLAREAEETGRATLLKLGDQSEKLASTERHLDVSKGHSQRAEDNADEIKKLNRSIFIPVVGFNKDSKRRAQEQKREQRFNEEKDERERAMKDVRDSQNRLGGYGDEEGIGGRRQRSAADMNARKAGRSRFQFEATQSDDEMEDEIDDNIDEIGDAASRLGKLALAMGQEVNSQNERLDRIAGKTDKLNMRIDNNTERLKRIR